MRSVFFIATPSPPPHRRWTTLAIAMLGFSPWAQAGTPLAAADSEFAPAEVVSRIVAYTRWPGEPRPLVACISRQADDAAALVARLHAPEAPRPMVARDIAVDTVVPSICDLVYFMGWTPARQQAALRDLAQRPVLTIGPGADFCSDGGMFCLDSRSDGTHFEVNLDAVARSGLRVHPQVLRLARPGGRTG